MTDRFENKHEKPGFRALFATMLLSRGVLVSWAAFTVILTMAGPFGTYSEMALVPRTAYWGFVLAMSLVIAMGAGAFVRSIRSDLGEWPETLVVGTIFTVIFTPLLYLVNGTISNFTGRADAEIPMLNMALFIVLMPPLITSIKRVFISRREDEQVPEEPRKVRLQARLEPEAPGRIMHMSVRDHYVDVWTDQGFKSVLMRFSDAIAEAEDMPGLQVHRSHWVALDAVRSAEKERGRVFLTLNCGTKVPVSRGYHAVVEEAGLLQKSA